MTKRLVPFNQATKNKKKIFISWSQKYSKEIAIALKDVLETTIFGKDNLICFVSDVDISSGEDWWNKIQQDGGRFSVSPAV